MMKLAYNEHVDLETVPAVASDPTDLIQQVVSAEMPKIVAHPKASPVGNKKKPVKDRSELVRVQLDFPKEKIDELNEIMKDAGLETRKDLFNHALSIYVWAVNEKRNGNGIFAGDPQAGPLKELVMHSLDNIAAKYLKLRHGKFFKAFFEREGGDRE